MFRTKQSCRGRIGLFVIALSISAALTVLAQDQKKDEKPKAAPEADFMQAWAEMNKPGKEHAHLKRLVGEFAADVEFVMTPGVEPQKSKGKMKYEALLGGRYIQGNYSGEMMGQPFHGIMLLGYDNVKKKYVNTWIDEMNTGITVTEGTADAAGKVFTYVGEMDDPFAGGKRKYRQVTTVHDDKKHVFEWFESGPDGKEFRSMIITYTRLK